MIKVVTTLNAVEALLMIEGEEHGHFGISRGPTRSMSIGIDEEYQLKGYSRPLMGAVLTEMNLVATDKLYIDEDASEGFWDHVGLMDNPTYIFDPIDQDKEGYGYAKVITVKALRAFVGNVHEEKEALEVALDADGGPPKDGRA
jgi:hypothetical protein